MQSEHRFTTTPYDVDMCRTVVIWIDDDAQAPKTQDGWHASLYHNPSVWVSRKCPTLRDKDRYPPSSLLCRCRICLSRNDRISFQYLRHDQKEGACSSVTHESAQMPKT